MSGKLTRREAEVLDLLVEGFSDKQIAFRLGIVHTTVRKHLVHIRERLGLSNRVQLAVWYAREARMVIDV